MAKTTKAKRGASAAAKPNKKLREQQKLQRQQAREAMLQRLSHGVRLVSSWSLVLVLSGVTLVGLWTLYHQPVQRYVITTAVDEAEREQLQSTLERVTALHAQGQTAWSQQNLSEVRSAVEALRWVDTASLRRRWPDRIEVTFERAVPIARWGVDEYITASGDLVEMATPQHQLPAFRVAQATPAAAMRVYTDIVYLLRPLGLEVRALHQNKQSEWRVDLASGEYVLLGNVDLRARVERLVKVYGTAYAQNPSIAYFDLRYHSGVAVMPVSVSSEEPIMVATHQQQEQNNVRDYGQR